MAKLSISESSPVGVEGGTLAENIARYGRRWSGAGISPSLTVALAADLEAEYVWVKRSDLPEVTESEHNGLVTALAQEGYQPKLSVKAGCKDATPEWSEQIAYANLAIAEAMRNRAREAEAGRRDEEAELDAEAWELYRSGGACAADGWEEMTELQRNHWRTVARAARRLHGAELERGKA